MAQQLIDIGTVIGDGLGEPLRDGLNKVNENFTELYSGVGGGSTFTEAIYDFDTTTLDISLIKSGKIICQPTDDIVQINSFGGGVVGDVRYIWFVLREGASQKLAFDNNVSILQGTAVYYSIDTPNVFITFHCTEVGKWVITDVFTNQKFLTNKVDVNSILNMNGTYYCPLTSEEMYPNCLLVSDTLFTIDETAGQTPGIRKIYLITGNEFNLTFDSQYFNVISGEFDPLGINLVEIVYSGMTGAFVTIKNDLLANKTSVKGATVEQLSLLPIELTSAEFFELVCNSGLTAKQFYLITDFKNENNVLEGIFVFAMSVNTFSFETTSKTYPDKKVWLKVADVFEFTFTYQQPQPIIYIAYTSKNVLTLYNAMRTNFERRREGDFNTLVIYAIADGNEITLTTENEGTEWSYDIVTHQITLLGALAASDFSFLDIDLVPDSSIYISFDYYTVSKRHGALSDTEIAKTHTQGTDTQLMYYDGEGGEERIYASDLLFGVENAHYQNSDTKLADGTLDEVSAAELRGVVDFANIATPPTAYQIPHVQDVTGVKSLKYSPSFTFQDGTLTVTGAGNTTGKTFVLKNLAGTENVTVLDSGKVGFGVISPSYTLDVGIGYVRSASGFISGNHRLSSSDGYYTPSTNLLFKAGLNDSATADIIWYTNNGGTNTERARITSAGLFGIATTTPAKSLEVSHATGNCFRLSYDKSTTYKADFTLDAAGKLTIAAADGVKIQGAGNTTGKTLSIFNLAGTENVTVLDNGNVGIGITNPGYKLSVVGIIQVLSSPTGFFCQYTYNGTYSGINDYKFSSFNGTSAVDRLFINANTGKIGISTNTPAKALEVSHATGDCFRLSYDKSTIYKADFTLDSSGKLTIAAAGGHEFTGNLAATGYISGLKSGVFAYLSAPEQTIITTAATFQYIAGTFTNSVLENFTLLATPAIRYDGAVTQHFKIDWHATISADVNSTTVSIAIFKNGSIVGGSEMAVFCKTAAELYPLSGTCVASLAVNDTIQLMITSDGTGDEINVQYFTTTMNEFFD